MFFRVLPYSKDEDKDPNSVLYRLRVRPEIKEWVEELVVQKSKDLRPSSYSPVFCFHPRINNPLRLKELLTRMVSGAEVEEEDHLYILGGNHNFRSNVEVMKKLKVQGYDQSILKFSTDFRP